MIIPMVKNDEYTVYNGDNVQVMNEEIEPESIDFSVMSVPFAAIYSYTNKLEDMGNSSDYDDDFKLHFAFWAQSIFPLIKQGRVVAIHYQDTTLLKSAVGHAGIHDLSGDVIRLMESAGFICQQRITIDKNPQAVAIRTKAHSLLFKSLKKDQVISTPCNGDYLLKFVKPGVNQVPIKHQISQERWIRLAHPIWYHIKETNTLNTRSAKKKDNERHICPLQLDLIEDAIELWSNVGDRVMSPFMGIGSEGFVSLKLKRLFTGIEIKKAYFEESIKNLDSAIFDRDSQQTFRFNGACNA